MKTHNVMVKTLSNVCHVLDLEHNLNFFYAHLNARGVNIQLKVEF